MIGVESWKLVKVEPVEVQSLADLTDGVFALRISGGRSSVCGLGSGGMLCCAVRSRDIQWQFYNCLHILWVLITLNKYCLCRAGRF